MFKENNFKRKILNPSIGNSSEWTINRWK